MISVKASTRYRAVHDSGSREAATIRYAVVHCTEGATAEGAAAWFANQHSGGSTQIVVDDAHAFRTLPDLRIPWGAPPLNSDGVHIEIAGYTHWTRTDWLEHRARIEHAAFFVAGWCKRYGIPARLVKTAGLRLRRRGITAHMWVSAAFRETTHTDPGPGFPWDVFMRAVHAHMGVKVSRRRRLRLWIMGRRHAGWSWARIKADRRFKVYKRLGGH